MKRTNTTLLFAFVFAFLGALLLGAAPDVAADEGPGPSPSRQRARDEAQQKPAVPAVPAVAKADDSGFVPESRPAEMTTNVEAGLPAGPLVATAYGFIWLMVLAFVVAVAVRTARVEREVAELANKLGALEADAAGRPAGTKR